MKLLTSLLLIAAFTTSINADTLSNQIEKQCEYLTFENGEADLQVDGLLLGMVIGMSYAVPEEDSSNITTNNSSGEIKNMACKKAIYSIGRYAEFSFGEVYLWQLLKLLSSKR